MNHFQVLSDSFAYSMAGKIYLIHAVGDYKRSDCKQSLFIRISPGGDLGNSDTLIGTGV